MRLAEALRASKIRRAIGRDGNALIAMADDDGVCFLREVENISIELGYPTPWLELLPQDREYLNKLDWSAIEEKNALIQLAEAIDDWIEDDRP